MIIFVSSSGLVEVRMAARSRFGVMGKGSYCSGGNLPKTSFALPFMLLPPSAAVADGTGTLLAGQAFSSVPSTVKCSSEKYGFGCRTRWNEAWAISWSAAARSAPSRKSATARPAATAPEQSKAAPPSRTDELSAAIGEDGQMAGQACQVLLADVGGEPPD